MLSQTTTSPTTIDILAAVGDGATALCAIALVILAVIGLSTWKKQLLGTANHECARHLLRCALGVRRAIETFRASMYASELKRALTEEGHDLDGLTRAGLEMLGVPVARAARWNELMIAWSELEAAGIEAEALWDIESASLLSPLSDCFDQLRAAMRMEHQDMVAEPKDQQDIDAYKQVIVDSSQHNDFTEAVTKAIDPIKAVAQPYLKR